MFARVALLCGLLLLLPSPRAFAGAPDPAARLAEGERLLEAGEYAGAQAALQQVVSSAQQPQRLARALLGLGLIQATAGKPDAAVASFSAALTHAPGLNLDGDRHKPELVKLFQTAKQGLRGEVVVRGPGNSGTVLINNEVVGTAPVISALPAGVHNVEVRGLNGKWRHSTEVRLPPWRRVKVTVSARGYAVSEPVLMRRDAPVRGELSVKCDLPQAEVLLDGKSVGRAPYWGRSPAGVYLLQVRSLDGKLRRERRVLVAPGRREAVEMKLAGGAAASTSEPAADARKSGITVDPLRPSPPRRRIWTWVMAAATGAAGVAAVGLGVSAQMEADAYARDLEAWDRASSPDAQRDLEAQLPKRRRAIERDALGANIAAGVAGGLALVTVVLYFLEPRMASDEAAAKAAVVAPGTVRVRF